MRARDIGVGIGRGQPGANNSITDVSGVRVGHSTLIEGHGALRTGIGPIRTGVTVIIPREDPLWYSPVFAGCHRLNGNGEMTGLEWVRESGLLSSPIAITNTHSVGVVRDALVAYEARARDPRDLFWRLPVVGETWDGMLNDTNGQHVRAAHVEAAIAAASTGMVPEGSVGGGTGMICHGFKGGIGSSSRLVRAGGQLYAVGVLVQANHGRRRRLCIDGYRIGEVLTPEIVPLPLPQSELPEGAGSIIGIVGTDAPLLPTQLSRLAQRVGLGIARTGGLGENSSGDLFFAFSTANKGLPPVDVRSVGQPVSQIQMLGLSHMDAFFDAVVEATEEAILNALLASQTMVGRDGITAHALSADDLLRSMGRPPLPRGEHGDSSASL